MREVLGALNVEHGRELYRFAPLERERRVCRGQRRLPPVERRHDDTPLGRGFVNPLVGETVRARPRAAVQLDNDGKRPGALRSVETREERCAAVTEVLDILGLDLVAHGCTYFLKRLSNPRRMSPGRVESGEASRSTVTRSENQAHSLRAFLSASRSGMGCAHSKRL